MPQYDGSIRINTEIDAKNVTSQMLKITNQIQKAESEVSRLRERMKELENAKIPTDEYKEIQKQIESAEKKLAALVERQERFLSTGGKESTSAYQRMNYDAEQLRNTIVYAKSELDDLVESGKAFTLGADSDEYEKAADKIRELTSSIEANKLKLSELREKQTPVTEEFKKMKSSAEKAFDAVSKGSAKSDSILASFAKRIKSIALTVFIFSTIRKAFNAMISGMKTGFENLMNYSANFANSVQFLKNALSTLGNQLAAAFSPIVEMIIPWLTSLINAIATAMTYVAQFIAVLSGKSTFTRAKQVQDSYNKSLTGTASAAKKAYGALAKFDDLDVLQKQEEQESGGGASETVEDMFEEVPIDNGFLEWLNGILEKLKPILDYVKKIKDAFMEGFWDGLGDYEYRFEAIKKGLGQIKNALLEIWNDPAVRTAADEWAQSVAYLLGSLVGSAASIALTIAAAFIGGLGQYMEDNVDRIKNFLISAFNISSEINYLLADLAQTVAYIFEAFASESGIRFMAALIGSIADSAMGLVKLALRLGRDFLEMLILPITENADGFKTALEGMLGVGATVLEGLKESIDSIFDNLLSVYDAKIKPFFDSIANGLSGIVSAFLSAWNGNVIPMLERVGAKFSEVLTDYITPFVNSVVEFVGNLATILQAFWETFLVPLVEWIITYAVPIISAIIEVLVNVIIIAVESILAILTELMNIINDVIIPIWQSAWETAGEFFNVFFDLLNTLSEAIKELISGLFKSVVLFVQGDWKGAWENAQNVFEVFRDKVSGIVDTVRGILEGFFEWVSSMISSILEGLSSIGSAISGAFSNVGSFVGGLFGGGSASSVSYSAPISAYSYEVPALASGSVIRGGNPFIALLGDQPAGQTNIEAPLATIEEALENVMSRNGFGERVPLVVNLNYDGETFARLSLDDIFAEATRQGYDLSVLGVT